MSVLPKVKCLLSSFALTPVIVLCAPHAPARANLMITPIYSTDLTPEARSIIASAISFYTSNITGNTAITIGFGPNGNTGGASANYSTVGVEYDAYLNQLNANRTESATDVSALASLPKTTPFVGSTFLTTTLYTTLGLGNLTPPTASTVPGCVGAVVNGCVGFGSNYLNKGANGGPTDGLFGVTEHEIDEVLGTHSSLSTSNPNAGSAADLFRYSAAGTRSLGVNPAVDGSCPATTPIAYLSIDSGKTNLAAYNNCSNGADCGDFASSSSAQVQDAFSNGTSASALSITSPEFVLLDAIGYNLLKSPTIAVGTETPHTAAVLSMQLAGDGGEDDGLFTSVPEPATLPIVAVGLVALWRLRPTRQSVSPV